MQIKPLILCPLSEWREIEITRGRSVGKKVKKRDTLVFSKWDMFWGHEIEGEEKIAPLGHYGSMATFLPLLDECVKDKEFAVNQIIGALVQRTGKKLPLTIDDPYNNLMVLGRWIDNQYSTSYLREHPPKVYYHIFKKELGIDDVDKITISEGE